MLRKILAICVLNRIIERIIQSLPNSQCSSCVFQVFDGETNEVLKEKKYSLSMCNKIPLFCVC